MPVLNFCYFSHIHFTLNRVSLDDLNVYIEYTVFSLFFVKYFHNSIFIKSVPLEAAIVKNCEEKTLAEKRRKNSYTSNQKKTLFSRYSSLKWHYPHQSRGCVYSYLYIYWYTKMLKVCAESKSQYFRLLNFAFIVGLCVGWWCGVFFFSTEVCALMGTVDAMVAILKWVGEPKIDCCCKSSCLNKGNEEEWEKKKPTKWKGSRSTTISTTTAAAAAVKIKTNNSHIEK